MSFFHIAIPRFLLFLDPNASESARPLSLLLSYCCLIAVLFKQKTPAAGPAASLVCPIGMLLLHKQCAALLLELLNFLIDQLSRDPEFPRQTLPVHKFPYSPSEEFPVSADIIAEKRSIAADAAVHPASTTLQRNTAQPQASNVQLTAAFSTRTLSPVHSSRISSVFPVL